MENATTNTDYPLDASVSADALQQERRIPQRKTINGIVFVRDPFGGYIPESYLNSKVKVRTPKDALPALSSIRLSPQEIVMVIDLDGNNQIAHVRTVSVGLANQSQIHPREVFSGAIHNRAVSILIAHNHPSGNLEPSDSDLISTRRLVEAGKTLGIPVLDHLILSANGFLSLRERYPAYFS